ncbi:MAG: response regulator [Pseudoxanthomonas sp.]
MSATSGTPPRLLLVEDDPISAQFMRAALAALPADVELATDGAQALAATGAFDVWLIDANLPDGSGSVLLQHLRARHAQTPALAHTADASPGLRTALLQAGFADVLVKPMGVQILQGAVRSALGTRAQDEDWDDAAALAALGGHREHAMLLRQLFLTELPTTRAACLASFERGDDAALRGHLHRLQASCGFAGARALAGIASRWHASPGDADARDAFATASDRLLANRQD